MDSAQAQHVIESFRKGIPPNGFIHQFTVGRESEISELTERLKNNNNKNGSLLIKANYGSGKTHLLRFIHEQAISENYIVSEIAINSNSSVRFNRMDQIFGEVFRNIEVPKIKLKGPSAFFKSILQLLINGTSDIQRKENLNKLTNNGKWDYTNLIKSPALYTGLRAWVCDVIINKRPTSISQDVEGWLSQPWNYYYSKSSIYFKFIENMNKYFHDTWIKRCASDIFNFKVYNYRQSWDALADLCLLSELCGYKGLVILVDEFEDVFHNMTNSKYQQDALWNLFKIFNGEFPGISFFAVTPSFVENYKKLFSSKMIHDITYSTIDSLPKFEMSPLEISHLETLSMKILDTHGIAYNWEPDLVMKHSQLMSILNKSLLIHVEDRTRQVIISVVQALDRLFDISQ